jgi:hypothetical protein
VLKVVQVTQQFMRGGIPQVAVLRQALLDHIIVRRRQPRIETARVHRFFVNDPEHHGGGIASERFLPRKHRENDNAQREDIGAAVNFASLHLFG